MRNIDWKFVLSTLSMAVVVGIALAMAIVF